MTPTRDDVPAATAIATPGDTGLLLPAQRRWVADQAQVKIAEKGRRTGFTFGESADDVMIAAASRQAGGQNVYYIGFNLEMAREYIAACGRWAIGLQYAASEIGETVFDDIDAHGTSKAIKAFRIDFPSGFYILALSSRPRSLRGMQGIVVLDEAAFHDDLPGMIKAAMALLIWGGKVRIISTHNGVENYYNELLTECRAGRIPYSVHRCTFDDAVGEGLYRRICEVNGDIWTEEAEAKFVAGVRAFYRPNDAEELDCIPAQSGGVYLPLILLEPCVNKAIQVIRWTFEPGFVDKPAHERRAYVEALCREALEPIIKAMPAEDPSFFGSDFGRHGDLSVMWPGQVTKQNERRTAFVLELRNCPYSEQQIIFFWIADRLPRFTACKLDAGGNGGALAEAMRQRYGAEVAEEVKFSLAWYLENWPKGKALLEDRAVDLPEDRDVLGDFRAVKVVKGVPLIPQRTIGVDKGQRHGDAAIGYVLFVAATRTEPFAVGYEVPSTKPRDRYEPHSDRQSLKMRADDEDEFSGARERLTM